MMPLAAAAAEEGGGALFRVGPLEVTEAVVGTWLVMGAIVLVLALVARGLRPVPAGRLQVAVEGLYEALTGFLTTIMDQERARRFAPLIVSLFLFILVSNYSGLLPLLPEEPWYAAPTSHWGVTLGLALVVFAYVQYNALRTHGLRYFREMFHIQTWYMIPLMLPLGIAEELIKPFTLSMRLFVNIFAGETALAEMTRNIPYVIPLVIMVLELIAGAVQAFIFTALTTVYLSQATTVHEHH